MLNNYMKISLRYIRNHKAYSIINILGLAIGIACCLLVFIYVKYETGYDRYHRDVDRIFRVAVDSRTPIEHRTAARTEAPLAPILKDNFPQVEAAARVLNLPGVVVKYKDRAFYETHRMYAGEGLFDVLTIPFLEGDPGSALVRPNTVVVSERMALKYFGRDEPFGNTLNVNGVDYEVTGIAADPPANTHLKYDFILSLNTIKERYPMDAWFLNNFYTYVKLAPGVDASAFEEQMKDTAHRYQKEELENNKETYLYFLQSLPSIHLHSHLLEESEPPGNPQTLVLFTLVSALILIIACINFINLVTARSSNRAKEVGMRKVVGAQRHQLIKQFLSESLVLALLAFVCALFLVELAFPLFRQLTGTEFSFTDLFIPGVFLLICSIIILVTLTAGGYPAFLLSSFKPASVLKGLSNQATRGVHLRKILVLSQFAGSIILIICTITIYNQVTFMKNEPMGFEKGHKIIIPARAGARLSDSFETAKTELMKHPFVLAATASSDFPGSRFPGTWTTQLIGAESHETHAMRYSYTDADYIPLFGMEIVAGRRFIAEIQSDINTSNIINETAVRAFGFASAEEAVGKKFMGGFEWTERTIIGVVKDFNHRGLQNEIEPMVMQYRPSMFEYVILAVNTDDLSETIRFAEAKWLEIFPDSLFEYKFLDEEFIRLYQAEVDFGNLFAVFAFLGMFIGCLGLLGLASFTALNRTKEIGIRKALGASIIGIVILLSRQFTSWVLLANIVAWPVAYLTMNHWLQNFAYRIDIGIFPFLVSGLIAFLIALLTVSYQSIKAAMADPLNSLKYE